MIAVQFFSFFSTASFAGRAGQSVHALLRVVQALKGALRRLLGVAVAPGALCRLAGGCSAVVALQIVLKDRARHGRACSRRTGAFSRRSAGCARSAPLATPLCPPARRAARASRAALAHERRRSNRRLLRQLRARETLAARVPSAHVRAGVQAIAPFADHGAARRVAPARAARPGRGGGGDRARALRERHERLGAVAEEAGFESLNVCTGLANTELAAKIRV